MIYFDNNSTTPLHPEVKKIIRESLDIYGNPSSLHAKGREAKVAIEEARSKIASFIGAKPEEIIFTASASEGNNIIMNSVEGNVVSSAIEHPSGLSGEKVSVGKSGVIDASDIEKAIDDKTSLVSVMAVNNEIGTIQPIKEIREISNDFHFHTDAVQALGKIPFDVKNVDSAAFSAHKIYGPKGVAALYVKKGIEIKPLVRGGHQERGRRAGTENLIGIVAFGKAVEMLEKEMDENNKRVRKLRNRLREGIVQSIPRVIVNGDQDRSVSNTVNITFREIEGESILLDLDIKGVAVSTGSACSSRDLEPSHVIAALGVPDEDAHGSIRFSLGRENTEEEVDYVLEILPGIIKRLREISSV